MQWFVEETNNIIAKQVELYPDTFRGVCGLPLTPGVSPKAVVPYLEKCVKEQGFVGCLLNPDPGECSGVETPPLGDRFWYPLYEKLVELDIPGHIHSTGCRSERLPYSLHFINEESIAVVSLLTSNVFKDFPTLQDPRVARRRRHPVSVRAVRGQLAARQGRSSASPRRCATSTTTRCSTRRTRSSCCSRPSASTAACSAPSGPGVGTVKDPRTGRWLDETRFTIEAIDWLSDADKKMIFEDNAKKVFNLKVPEGVSSMKTARTSAAA